MPIGVVTREHPLSRRLRISDCRRSPSSLDLLLMKDSWSFERSTGPDSRARHYTSNLCFKSATATSFHFLVKFSIVMNVREAMRSAYTVPLR